MGPGFDSFGFAVDLENELVLERGAFEMDIYGEGENTLPRDESNAIISAVRDGYAAIFPDETLPVHDIKFTSINRIPRARSLGSSSSALVAGRRRFGARRPGISPRPRPSSFSFSSPRTRRATPITSRRPSTAGSR